MRAFYDSLDRFDCILGSKVITLPNYLKNYLEIQRPLVFRCQEYGHGLLTYLILMKTFQNWPNKFNSISGSKKITSPRFHELSFVLRITAETSKIKKRTRRGLYLTFKVLLKYFNVLGKKTFFCRRSETFLLTEKNLRNFWKRR